MIRAALVLSFFLAWLPAHADDAYGGAIVREEDAGVRIPVLTKPPALLQSVEPEFPEAAKAEGAAGDVTVQVDIDALGHVAEVQVVKGAGHGFDEAAVAAVKQFVFSPAEIDHIPAAVRIQYTQHFFYTPPPVPDAGTEPIDAGPPEPPIALAGHVLERASRKPLAGAAVLVSGVAEPSITDLDGAFAVHVAPGPITVEVREANHEPFHTTEVIAEGERVEATYFMMPKAYGLYETVVRGERDKKEVSRHTLSREELEKVPGTMGDPIRALEDLPGVARPPLLSGQLIIRGASPNDTGSYLDGVDLPLLFHFLDGPSIVSPEFLDRIDFYPGGFGSEYGRAIGGIIDVQTRAPKNDGLYHGSFSVDLLQTGGFFTAPLADGLTLSVAARRSYLELTVPEIVPLFTSAAIFVVPRYYDYQLRLDYQPPSLPHHKFSLFVFGSDDLLKVIDSGFLLAGVTFELNNHIDFQRITGEWTYHNDALTHTDQPFAGLNGISFGVGALDIDDHDRIAGWRDRTEYAFTPYFTGRVGLDMELIQSRFTAHLPSIPLDYRPFPGEAADKPPLALTGLIDEFDYGEWLEGELKLPWGMRFIPGVRVDEFELHGNFRHAADPRFIVREDFGGAEKPTTAIKASFGEYHESPGAANLDPLFGNPTLPLQGAWQTSLGVEHRFSDVINLDVTGFYNHRFDLAEGTNAISVGSNGQPSRTLVEAVGDGRAYGLEVLARHEITQHFFGWVAYTLSWSQEKTSGYAWHWAQFDQRHILTLIAQYKFGNGWEVGGRFRLATGNPNTAVVGAVFDGDTQSYRAIDGTENGSRLPTFNQLDLRVDKTWLFDRWQLGVYLDVQNVYDARNQEGVIPDYRFQTQIVVPGIPILPTLGVKGSF